MEDAHIAHVDMEAKSNGAGKSKTKEKSRSLSLFGVFDGHGGCEVAKFCEEYFQKEFVVCEAYKKGLIKEALTATFLRMDEMLRDPAYLPTLMKYKDKNAQTSGILPTDAGCTANVLVIWNDTIWVANAGDSRTVLSCGTKAIALSVDHKPELPDERDRVQAAGGTVKDGRINENLNLSRAIGDLVYKDNPNRDVSQQVIIAVPDVVERKLEPNDQFLLMGCDGIWERDDNQHIINIFAAHLNKGTDKQQIMEEFFEETVAPDSAMGIGCDNMTAILIVLKHD